MKEKIMTIKNSSKTNKVHWEKKSIKLINSSQTNQGKTWISNTKYWKDHIRADSRNSKQMCKKYIKKIL